MIDDNLDSKNLSELHALLPEIFDDDNIKFSFTRLKSKKNMVYSIEFETKPIGFPKQVIVKIFRTPNAQKEHDTLIKLEEEGLLVPRIIFFKPPYLILEKVRGSNLCDFINEQLLNAGDTNQLNSYVRDRIIFSIKKLSNWLAQMHKKNILTSQSFSEFIVLNKGDTRLRDFVLSSMNDEIYGLDFEESYEGNPIDDLAWVCCAILDTNPGIFEIKEPKMELLALKIELINIFLKEYYRINGNFKFNFEYFANKLIDYLNIVMERRDAFGIIDPKRILKNLSNKL